MSVIQNCVDQLCADDENRFSEEMAPSYTLEMKRYRTLNVGPVLCLHCATKLFPFLLFRIRSPDFKIRRWMRLVDEREGGDKRILRQIQGGLSMGNSLKSVRMSCWIAEMEERLCL